MNNQINKQKGVISYSLTGQDKFRSRTMNEITKVADQLQNSLDILNNSDINVNSMVVMSAMKVAQSNIVTDYNIETAVKLTFASLVKAMNIVFEHYTMLNIKPFTDIFSHDKVYSFEVNILDYVLKKIDDYKRKLKANDELFYFVDNSKFYEGIHMLIDELRQVRELWNATNSLMSLTRLVELFDGEIEYSIILTDDESQNNENQGGKNV